MSDVFDNVMDLAKRRGFVWPTTECYGSVAGFIDYGPLGTLVKRRIEDLWRQFYVISEGYYEIECPTIGQEAMYIASGHVKGFLTRCASVRHATNILGLTILRKTMIYQCCYPLLQELAEKFVPLPCPACSKVLGKVEVFSFNLMFQTTIGPGC